MREIGVHLPSERSQHFGEEGRRGDAVHVVVAKNDESFIPFARGEEALDGSAHVRQEKRISKVLEARLEEAGNRLGLAETSVEETLREQRGDLQLPGEDSHQRRL